MRYSEWKNKRIEAAMQFSQTLLYWRKRKGITQSELAEKAGIAPNTLRRYESGATCPDPDSVQKIAVALGVKAEDLVNLDSVLKNETVSERITRLRRLRGMTQEELGGLVGSTKSTVAKYESGKGHMKSSTLTRIAEALEVSYEYLVLGKPQDTDFLDEGVTPPKRIQVVLAAVQKYGEDEHRLVFKTLPLRVPNDGLEWHVVGEEKRDNK